MGKIILMLAEALKSSRSSRVISRGAKANKEDWFEGLSFIELKNSGTRTELKCSGLLVLSTDLSVSYEG